MAGGAARGWAGGAAPVGPHRQAGRWSGREEMRRLAYGGLAARLATPAAPRRRRGAAVPWESPPQMWRAERLPRGSLIPLGRALLDYPRGRREAGSRRSVAQDGQAGQRRGRRGLRLGRGCGCAGGGDEDEDEVAWANNASRARLAARWARSRRAARTSGRYSRMLSQPSGPGMRRMVMVRRVRGVGGVAPAAAGAHSTSQALLSRRGPSVVCQRKWRGGSKEAIATGRTRRVPRVRAKVQVWPSRGAPCGGEAKAAPANQSGAWRGSARYAKARAGGIATSAAPLPSMGENLTG
jgi:hypothetical protein